MSNIIEKARKREADLARSAEVRQLKTQLENTRRELAASRLVCDELELLLRDAAVSQFQIPTQRTRKGKAPKSFYRVAFGDTHGASLDPAAWGAFLRDVEHLQPREIVHGGDIVDCGGWLAEHQVMSYLPEVSYSYWDDINAANQMWDQLQAACPTSQIHAIQGNHDVRVERWCIQQTRKHRVDASELTRHLAPENLMSLDKRGIKFYRRDTTYGSLKGNAGSLQLGKCAFTHPQRASKHHAARMAEGWGTNVVFFHTHRRDSFTASNARGEQWGAWNPGCMCALRKYYHHSENWQHSHGYHLQIVQRDGTFLPVNVPIIDGKSYLCDLLKAMK